MDQVARAATAQQLTWLGAGLCAALFRHHTAIAIILAMLMLSAVVDRRWLKLAPSKPLPAWQFAGAIVGFAAFGWFL